MVDRVINVRFQESGGAQVVSTFQRIGTASTALGTQVRAANTNLAQTRTHAATAATGLNQTTTAARNTTAVMGGLNTLLLRFLGFEALRRTITGTFRAFADYERALTGVGKTTNLAGRELADFGERARALAPQLGVTAREFLNVSQIAGQLGIQGTAALEKFTATVIKLESATDLTAEQASFALARIINTSDATVESVDSLGNVLVALGNNMAATESEILDVASQLTRVASDFGVTAEQALGMSAAFAAINVQAESARTATLFFFRELEAAVRTGGPELQTFADVMGVSADEVARLFREAPVEAFNLFITGLQGIADSGGSVAETLEQVHLSQARVEATMRGAATAADEFVRAQRLVSEELEKQNALQTEFDRVTKTLQFRLLQVQNAFLDLGITLGRELRPAFEAIFDLLIRFADAVRRDIPDLVQRFENMTQTVRDLRVAFDDLSASGSNSGRPSFLQDLEDALNGTLKASQDFGAKLRAFIIEGGIQAVINRAEGLWQEFAAQTRLALTKVLITAAEFGRDLVNFLDPFGDNAGRLLGLEAALDSLQDRLRQQQTELEIIQGLNAEYAAELGRVGESVRGVTADVQDHTATQTQFIKALNVRTLQDYRNDLQLVADEIENFGLSTAETTVAVENLSPNLKELEDRQTALNTQLEASRSSFEGLRIGAESFFIGLGSNATNAFELVNSGLNTARDALADFFATGEFSANAFFDALRRDAAEFFADQLLIMIRDAGAEFLGFLTTSESAHASTVASMGATQQSFWADFIDLARGAGSFLLGVLSDMGSGIASLFSQGRSLFDGFVSAITGGLQALGSSGIVGAIAGGLRGIGSTIVSVATSAVRSFTSFIGGLFADGGLVQRFAGGGDVQGFPSGGAVHGPGGPRDDLVPAMLSNGEYVINARAVRMVGVPFLDAINDNRVPHFQTGGVFTSPEDPAVEQAIREQAQREATINTVGRFILGGAGIVTGPAALFAALLSNPLGTFRAIRGLFDALGLQGINDPNDVIANAGAGGFNDQVIGPALAVAQRAVPEIVLGAADNFAANMDALASSAVALANSGATRRFPGPFMSRAFGGPVRSGQLYETHGLGEREFFVPGSDGQIVTGNDNRLLDRRLARIERILLDSARSDRVVAENTTQLRRGGQSRALAGRAA